MVMKSMSVTITAAAGLCFILCAALAIPADASLRGMRTVNQATVSSPSHGWLHGWNLSGGTQPADAEDQHARALAEITKLTAPKEHFGTRLTRAISDLGHKAVARVTKLEKNLDRAALALANAPRFLAFAEEIRSGNHVSRGDVRHFTRLAAKLADVRIENEEGVILGACSAGMEMLENAVHTNALKLRATLEEKLPQSLSKLLPSEEKINHLKAETHIHLISGMNEKRVTQATGGIRALITDKDVQNDIADGAADALTDLLHSDRMLSLLSMAREQFEKFATNANLDQLDVALDIVQDGGADLIKSAVDTVTDTLGNRDELEKFISAGAGKVSELRAELTTFGFDTIATLQQNFEQILPEEVVAQLAKTKLLVTEEHSRRLREVTLALSDKTKDFVLDLASSSAEFLGRKDVRKSIKQHGASILENRDVKTVLRITKKAVATAKVINECKDSVFGPTVCVSSKLTLMFWA